MAYNAFVVFRYQEFLQIATYSQRGLCPQICGASLSVSSALQQQDPPNFLGDVQVSRLLP